MTFTGTAILEGAPVCATALTSSALTFSSVITIGSGTIVLPPNRSLANVVRP